MVGIGSGCGNARPGCLLGLEARDLLDPRHVPATLELAVEEGADAARATSIPTIRAPIESTLASLCSRPSRAVTGSAASTQRMPRTLFATIASPVPLPPSTIPRSNSPRATARATGAITSG